MNLMPTLISIGLAASVSLFYLQNQSAKPKEINYRAALSEFEQSAIAFAAHTPLDSNNPQPQSHCQNNMLSDFSKRLPAGSQWTVNIAGLDCDTAILSLTSADSDDFNNLLSAARASGRSYATETDTSVTPPTKTIKWTQRLYTRTPSDLGIRAQLKNNRTNSCLDNPCSNTILMPVGTWQKKGGCSKTCDGGIQQYECIGGKCSQTKPNTQCNTDPCPAIGKWQEDGCTETCGTGIQQYKCIGGECNTPKPSQSCNTNPCPAIGQWQKDGCTETCGTGIQQYRCIGGTCDEAKPNEVCNTEPCPTPIDGLWSNWSNCTQLCGDELQKRYCNNPVPQHNGKQCKRKDKSLTSENNNWEEKSCYHAPCNRAPVIKNQTFYMEGDTPITFQIRAFDPDHDTMTFWVLTRDLGYTTVINANKGEFEYYREPGTFKIFTDKDAKNTKYEKTLDKFIVEVRDEGGLWARAIVTIEINEINDPPSIKKISQTPEPPLPPLLDRDFSVELKITDPDYDFSNEREKKVTKDGWLKCSFIDRQIGSMIKRCEGLPQQSHNPFSINVRFDDGYNNPIERKFNFEAISMDEFLKR